MTEASVVIREAIRADMPGLWEGRYSVTENTLAPGRISDEELLRSIEENGRGIGSALHAEMLEWFSRQPLERLWLTTGIDTRDRRFYEARGWQYAGPCGPDEIRLERRNAA